jgi:hypothetical protein
VGALNKAVNYADSKGALVVSSAGNDAVDLDKDRNGPSSPASPARVFASARPRTWTYW